MRTPSCADRVAGTYGSYAMTVMSNAASRSATRTPMRPRPRMPTTLSCSSTPVYADRFHLPSLSDAIACGTFRASASSSATACSAALTMLEDGALTTITPAFVAASTSTLSSPTPARATTRSRGAAAIASASIWVALRTMTASTSASAGSSLPAVRAVGEPDLERGFQERYAGRGELFGDENDWGGHGSSVTLASGFIVYRPACERLHNRRPIE